MVRFLFRFLTPKRLILLGKGLVIGGNLMRIGTVLLAVLVSVGALATLLPWWQDFRRELRHINEEIQRTTGRERAHWEKRRRRLYLSLIPFVKY